jgi:hypothetical protein
MTGRYHCFLFAHISRHEFRAPETKTATATATAKLNLEPRRKEAEPK